MAPGASAEVMPALYGEHAATAAGCDRAEGGSPIMPRADLRCDPRAAYHRERHQRQNASLSPAPLGNEVIVGDLGPEELALMPPVGPVEPAGAAGAGDRNPEIGEHT